MGAKLARGEIVMANFICQLDCSWNAQIKYYFWEYL